MRIAMLCALLTIGSLAIGHAQVPLKSDPIPPSWHQAPGQSPLPNVDEDSSHPHEDAIERLEREQRIELNAKRQKQAIADATRLTALSQELETELAQADFNGTLSAGASKKLDEIIRLAKSVRGKMHRY